MILHLDNAFDANFAISIAKIHRLGCTEFCPAIAKLYATVGERPINNISDDTSKSSFAEVTDWSVPDREGEEKYFRERHYL
jgi:hypothetical protein